MESLLLAEVDKIAEDVITLLSRMVAAPSVNPPGDTEAVAQVVSDWLSGENIDNRFWTRGQHKSVIAELRGREPGPTLVFSSHLDTVGVGDTPWQYHPFSGIIKDGRLYGRGCADAKAQVAAMCAAAAVLNRLGCIKRGTLVINPVADEETGAVNGTAAILDEGAIKPDLCIIGEITGNQVATAEKGVMDVTLTTRGSTAHASTPWDGVNAIDSMVELLKSIKLAFAEKFAGLSHPLTPPPTMNVGLVSGGVRSNVVPDSCQAVLDFRIIPGMSFDEIIEMVQCEVSRLGESMPGFVAEIQTGRRATPYETSADNELVTKAISVCHTLGLTPNPIGFRQCSDGTFYARRGVPTILFGPGEPEVAHAPNESIAVDDVVTATKALTLMAYRLLS